MNKRTILLILAIIVMVVGVGFYIALRQESKDNQAAKTANNHPAGVKKACELLPFSVAKSFLGSETTRNTSVPEGGQGSTEAVDISNCTYNREDSSDAISLTVRGAHENQMGYNTNRYGFEDARELAPGFTDSEIASEDVPSLGDHAYYNPSTDQTNVLIRNGQYWFIIQASDKDIQRKVGSRILTQLGL